MACRGEPTLKNITRIGAERALTPAEEYLFVVRFGHELIHADLEFMRKGWQHISASQQGLSLALLLVFYLPDK